MSRTSCWCYRIAHNNIFSSHPINADHSKYVVVCDSVTPTRSSAHKIVSELFAETATEQADLVKMLPYPIRVQNGLSVGLGQAGVTPTGNVTVFYRKLKPLKGSFDRPAK